MRFARSLGETAAAIANLHPAHRPAYDALVTARASSEADGGHDATPPLARVEGERRNRERRSQSAFTTAKSASSSTSTSSPLPRSISTS